MPDLRSIGRVVSELQASYPDVTESSLRFLEREGLIKPTRTTGGHRLFSVDDVERVRRIKSWQAQRLSLAEIRHRLAALNALPPADALADEFVRYAARGDLEAAARVVLQTDDLGMPLVRLFQDILTPALHQIGDRWASGLLLVGQEKEISELVRDLIAELSHRHAHLAPNGPSVVAACVAGERHDLALRMACALLRERGWRVHFLGADVAADFLMEAVRLHSPAAVVLSATRESRLQALEATLVALAAFSAARSNTAPAIVIGGPIANDHAKALQHRPNVVALADRLDAVIDGSLDALLHKGDESAP